MNYDAMQYFCNVTTTAVGRQVRVGTDCFGENPQVDCPCCASCYDKDSNKFVVNIPGICASEANMLELYGQQQEGNNNRGTVCGCNNHEDDDNNDAGNNSNTAALSCYETCQSCNLDETVCAVTADYTRQYTEDGFYQSETTTFLYVKGISDTVVKFQSNWNEAEYCKVFVNGEKCRECSFHVCRDDFIAFGVICDNVEGVGGNYSPCDENDDYDDALAVLSFQDPLLVNGCTPWFPRF